MMEGETDIYAGPGEVQRLCGHHVTDSFDCGDHWLNQQLQYFQHEFEDGADVFGFVVADADNRVLAYMILNETFLVHQSTEEVIRCFTVPAMAVNKHPHKSDLFSALIQRAQATMKSRSDVAKTSGAAPYQGIICFPGRNETLRRWLVGWKGFSAIGESDLYWLPIEE